LHGESAGRPETTWIYSRLAARERRYWNFHHYDPANLDTPYRQLPTLETEYVPVRHTVAEVVFENGFVKSWRKSGAEPSR
jgi:hypothetical protein